MVDDNDDGRDSTQAGDTDDTAVFDARLETSAQQWIVYESGKFSERFLQNLNYTVKIKHNCTAPPSISKKGHLIAVAGRGGAGGGISHRV